MPIYEYACESCDHHFETMQSITAPPIAVCPSCGAEKVRKQISASGFVLKGSGWYLSDYARKDSQKPDHKSEAPTDQKPAPKADEKSAPKKEGASETAAPPPAPSPSQKTTAPASERG